MKKFEMYFDTSRSTTDRADIIHINFTQGWVENRFMREPERIFIDGFEIPEYAALDVKNAVSKLNRLMERLGHRLDPETIKRFMPAPNGRWRCDCGVELRPFGLRSRRCPKCGKIFRADA